MLAARFKQAVAAGGVVPLGARCHGIEESLLQGEAENHQQGSESGVGVLCVLGNLSSPFASSSLSVYSLLLGL